MRIVPKMMKMMTKAMMTWNVILLRTMVMPVRMEVLVIMIRVKMGVILPRGVFSAVELLAAVYHWPRLKGFFVPNSQKANTANPTLPPLQPITSTNKRMGCPI